MKRSVKRGRVATPTRRWWQRKPLTPDQALGWLELRHLFIGQCLVLALHLLWMPIWLGLPALLAALWRFQQLRARVPRAGIVLRLAAVAMVTAGLFLEYGQMLKLEAMIGLLLGIYLLKLLETESLRDGRVVCGLGLVVLAAAFLHDQGPLMAMAAVLTAGWLVGGLVLIAGARTRSEALRETAWLMGLSLPLMLGLFVLFPRLPPLWNVPHLQKATTGLTDSVSPGDIAALGRSDTLAFRVRFEEGLPAASQRYWRVYTLSLFDGVRWSRATPERLQKTLGGPASRYANRATQIEGESILYRYELLLEPDSRPWRPSLGTPLASSREASYVIDGTLEGLTSLDSRALLQLASSGAPPVIAPPWMQCLNLMLPDGNNPRAREFADKLMQQAGGDPQRFLSLLFQYFNRNPYYYTLTPSRLEGVSRVDDFLFDSLSGYCTHYASTSVFLARAAGLPARMVAGYLGGEAQGDDAPKEEHELSVRQYDAHAWVEVFYDNRWNRFDPTAAVAPERISQGALSLQGQSGFMEDSGLRAYTFNNSVLSDLRRQWERFEYRWQRSVVGFRLDQQRNLWQRIFGDFRWEWLAWGMLGMLACVALLGATLVLWSGRAALRHPGIRVYSQLNKRLERSGAGSMPGEAPGSHLRRIAVQQQNNAAVLSCMATLLEQWLYNDIPLVSGVGSERQKTHTFLRQWRRLSRKIHW